MLHLRLVLLGLIVFATSCVQEGPGIYDGDPSLSCDDVCAEQSLACDEEHVWSTDIFGFSNRGGGERRYQRSSFDRENVRFPCETVPPDTIERSGETYEGTDKYECACINPGADAGSRDAGSPDAGVDVPAIIIDSGTPDSGTPDSGTPDAGPRPGTYPGDVEDRRSCEDVCVTAGLSCNARHRWPGSVLLAGDPGGCQASFGESTVGFGCYAPPPATYPGFPPLASYRCACVADIDVEGELLNEVEQEIGNTSVYQGLFTVIEAADVTYVVQDNYRITRSSYTVAVVPSASIDAYLAGEEPLVYEAPDGTVSLPADDYVLAVTCQNAVSPCTFHTRVVLD